MNRERMLVRFGSSLKGYAEYITRERDKNSIYNDVFELAYDMGSLALSLVEDPPEEGYDHSIFLRQNKEDLDGVRALYGDRLRERPFADIMSLVEEFVAFAEQLPPPHPDGPFGSKRIVRETFAFLSEFGLEPDPSDAFRYASDRVVLALGMPAYGTSDVCVSHPGDPSNYYRLENILFMETGRIDWIELPPGQTIESAADVQDWYTFVADALRAHGTDVLAGRPGVWERLEASSQERDRLLGEQAEREFAAEQEANGTAAVGSP